MGGPARGGRHLAPAVAENPVNEPPAGGVVARVARTRMRAEQAEVLEEIVELVAQRQAAAQQVAAHLAADLHDEGRFRLLLQVIIRQKVREQFPVLEHRVDGLAEETGLAAKPAHGLAVSGTVIADDARWRRYSRRKGSLLGVKSTMVPASAVDGACAMPCRCSAQSAVKSGDHLAVNAEKPVENAPPVVAFGDDAAAAGTDGRASPRGSCARWRRRAIPGRFSAAQIPEVAENDAVHVAAANADHRRPARLAFQRDQAEGLLHAGMHEQVRRPVEPRQFARVAAIRLPGDRARFLLRGP